MILLLFIPLYFAPSIVAIARKAPDMGSVIVLNFFLGWTFIGWVLSLAMAARSSSTAAINVNVHQQLQPQAQPLPHPQPGYAFGYGQVAGAQPYQLPVQGQPNGQIPMPNGHGQAVPRPGS